MMLWFGPGSASELGVVRARVVWLVLCGSGGFGAATVGVVTAPSRFSGSGEAAWPTPQAEATFASVSRLATDPIPLSVQFRTQSGPQYAVLGRLGHGNHRLREGDIG